MMTRRAFLPAAGLKITTGCLSCAWALPPPAGLKLGFDTYTLRGFRWKAIALLDYAARMRLDTIQFSSLRDFESLESGHLHHVRNHANRLGISIDGGIGCICPTSSGWRPENRDPTAYLLEGLRVSHALGATCMRVFMGGSAERVGPVPFEKHIEATVKVLRSVGPQARDLNVKIGVENHGDFQAWELRAMVEEAGREFVGVCLDTGNPIPALEDPLVTLETLGPYVVTTHIRDTALYEHPEGIAWQWVALGDGAIDLPRFFRRYRELCPHAGVQLEIITGRSARVLPYLEPEFWSAFPKAKAAELARFVALAKKGKPFMGSMIIAGGQGPPEYEVALREQQRVDLERSLDYASKVLGLGLRRKA